MEENEMLEGLPSLAGATPLEIAMAARDALDAKKGNNVTVLHVEKKSDITDYLVLATGNSNTHVKTLCDEVEYRLGLRELQPLHSDREARSNWQVVDFGSVMVHVFDAEARSFYNLDKLYKDTTEVSEQGVDGNEV